MLERLQRHAKQAGAGLPLVRNLVLKIKYHEEIKLINASSTCRSDHRSVLHFSVNKSATQYVKHILRSYAKANEMTHVDLGGYAFHSEFPYLDQLSDEEFGAFRHVFHPCGYVYSPFGGMIDGLRDMEHYHVMLVLRDPRDALTSEFFSIRHSHRMPPALSNKHDDFRARQCRARSLSIDEYVIAESPRVQATYQRYVEGLLRTNHNVRLLKYEDLILDFPGWLDQLEATCEFERNAGLRDRLIDEAGRAASRKEQIESHARQRMPGDHRRKLAPNTVAELNERFAYILDSLDYERS